MAFKSTDRDSRRRFAPKYLTTLKKSEIQARPAAAMNGGMALATFETRNGKRPVSAQEAKLEHGPGPDGD
jgi:hypothetical protein